MTNHSQKTHRDRHSDELYSKSVRDRHLRGLFEKKYDKLGRDTGKGSNLLVRYDEVKGVKG
jgi:hypothetical protein